MRSWFSFCMGFHTNGSEIVDYICEGHNWFLHFDTPQNIKFPGVVTGQLPDVLLYNSLDGVLIKEIL